MMALSPDPFLTNGLTYLAAVLAGVGVICLVWGGRTYLALARLNARLEAFAALSPETARPREKRVPIRARLAQALAWVGRAVSAILPDRQVQRTRANLIAAGYSSPRAVTYFLAAKALLAPALTCAAWLMARRLDVPPLQVLLFVALGGLLGFYLPGMWLGRRMTARRQEISRALPDALDLLSISVSAGLGFDSALIEVIQKWNNPLTEELSVVERDMRLGKSRREALRALGDRTGVPDVGSFATAVIQADELGTPIREALRAQADQMRMQRRQRAEEKARQAVIKMLIPMVLLIFPAIFVVLIGPAIPGLMKFGG